MAARDSTEGEQPVRAIFGAEVTVRGRRGRWWCPGCRRRTGRGRAGQAPALDVARARRPGVAEPVPAAHARARAYAGYADRRAGQPSVSLDAVLEHADGPGVPDRLPRAWRRGRADRAAAARRVRPRLAAGRAAAPLRAADMQHNRARERLARRLGVPTVATGDVHAHTKMRRAAAGRVRRDPHGQTLDASEVQLRPNDTHVLATPAGMAARFEDLPGRRGGERAARRDADVRPDRRPRLPLPGSGRRRARAAGWRRSARRSSSGATPPGYRRRVRRRGVWRRSWR